jgi:hypothetical protein
VKHLVSLHSARNLPRPVVDAAFMILRLRLRLSGSGVDLRADL